MASSADHVGRATTSTITNDGSPPTLKRKAGSVKEQREDPPLLASLSVIGEFIYYALEHIVFSILETIGLRKHLQFRQETGNEGFAELYTGLDTFYVRYILYDTMDTVSRPLRTAPAAEIEILEREFINDYQDWRLTGKILPAVNIGTYDYLGFSETTGACPDAVQEATEEYGTSLCSSRHELGTTELHREVEELVARFVRKPAAMCFGMGFAANSMNIPVLADKGCLILSDELSHNSMVLGCRLSGAKIQSFKHNDMDMLERKLRKAVLEGQPVTKRPWKKILILVEGIYSMEGTIVNLPEVVRLKNKYKAYLYIDEAHSVGTLGKNCSGVTEHFGIDPAEVDVIMGSFTKSFASSGGFVAASEEVISNLRRQSHSSCYAPSMPIPLVQQVLSSFRITMGEDGTNDGERRKASLWENTAYFRRRLKEMGYIVYGDPASPAIPVITIKGDGSVFYLRWLLEHGVATVLVGFPAVPMFRARVRFCVAASHTREMLDKALAAISECGDICKMKYKK